MRQLWELGVRNRLWVLLAGALLALPMLWVSLRGSSPELARDFEECVELVQANGGSNEESRIPMTGCNARFAGRRKSGGGYTYYDFMMDRNFEIAGPNPTPQERKEIDRAYMGYLDAQRQEAISAELARRQNEQLWAEMERARQSVGRPMVLTPTALPLIAAKRDKPKPPRCADESLSCSWAKITTAVKNAFASSSKAKQ